MKNGNSDGTTFFAHKVSPVFAAKRLDCENITRKIRNKENMIDRIFLCIRLSSVNLYLK